MGKTIAAGSCGKNVKFTITEEGEKVIALLSGKGEMNDFEQNYKSDFDPYKDIITEVFIEDGITTVGDCAFRECAKLTSVRIPGSVRYIGIHAFAGSALTSVRIPEGVKIIAPKAFEKCPVLEKLHLPSTLKSIDFKAFNGDETPLKISYNGSRRQWQECVRISSAAKGNNAIFNAEFKFTEESVIFRRMLLKAAAIIRNGGDGRLHILAPDLTVTDTKKKSGDTTFIIFPKGQTMLIDAGVSDSLPRFMSFLRPLGLKKLDYFVITHPHGDHADNAPAAMKYIYEEAGGTVGTYIFSGFTAKNQGEPKARAYLESKGTRMLTNARAGDAYDIDGVHIDVFNPDDELMALKGLSDDIVNNTSVCFKFTFGQSSFLSTGDLYANRERELVNKYGSWLHTGLMKANHHAAYTSSTAEWIGAVSPKYAFSEEDGMICSRLDERMKAAGVKNYKVSRCGLFHATLTEDGKYIIRTEYKA